MHSVSVVQETIDDLDVTQQTAVLSLAWGLRRKVNERFLLSATIEVGPPPTLSGIDDIDSALRSHELDKHYLLFFRRYLLTGDEGLAWFRACQAGAARLPEVEDGHTLETVTLLSEPPFPALMCASSLTPGAVLPFGPGRRASLIPDRLGWEASYWDEIARSRRGGNAPRIVMKLAWSTIPTSFDR